MITIYSAQHRHQDGRFELIDGRLQPPVERPQRAEAVLARVREVGLGAVLDPEDFGTGPIERVHAPDFVTFLRGAHDDWRAEHGDSDALPLNWPCRGFRQRVPDSIDGRLSYYSFDAGTPITAGTWTAAVSSANVALTGARRLREEGERAVFCLCRPPGHHASRDLYGGYCFLNNAAIAAQWLLDNGAGRVAVLDIDYHHGNGTQSIFYDRADVLFASLHADPAQEFPYFLGYDDETGTGAGEGFNLNLVMPWGTGWDVYGRALETALARIADYAPDCVVVSLGVDTFEEDPISRFRLRTKDYPLIGGRLASIGLPTLFVMEGGYALAEIGENTVGVLAGFEGA